MYLALRLALGQILFLSSLAVFAQGGRHSDQTGDEFAPRDPLVMMALGISEAGLDWRLRQQLKRCDATSVLSLCEVAREFANAAYHEELNSVFWGSKTDLLFFGERHLDQHHQEALASLLPGLAGEGFQVLALEMFNEQAQPALDLFNQGQLSLDALVNLLTEHWNYPMDGYRVLLQEAQAHGFRLVALDDRKAELARQDLWGDLLRRDQIMAANLLPHLDEKVVVYSGRLHAVKSFSQDQADQVPTIREILLKSKPDLQIENYMFSNRKGHGFAPVLQQASDTRAEVFKSPSLSHYVDGFIFADPAPESFMVSGSFL